jgi:hypothetical protein
MEQIEKTTGTRPKKNGTAGLLMTVADLEDESGVSRYTWRSWIKTRKIASVHLGRRVFVARTDFEKLLKPGRVEAREALKVGRMEARAAV